MIDFNKLQQEAQTANLKCVVSGLIRNAEGRIFAQKRTPDRKLFPGCWDLAGGHVDPGETLYDALVREIEEETGWKLVQVVALINQFDWESSGIRKREFDFLVEVEGNLDHPLIETEKFSTYDWFGLDNLETLKENRQPGDHAIYETIRKALSYIQNEQ